eukprot:746090-Hanusia_phi.AAC.5
MALRRTRPVRPLSLSGPASTLMIIESVGPSARPRLGAQGLSEGFNGYEPQPRMRLITFQRPRLLAQRRACNLSTEVDK